MFLLSLTRSNSQATGGIDAEVARHDGGHRRSVIWYNPAVTKFESVLEQALELDEDEREMLVLELEIALGECTDSDDDEAWDAELKERLNAIDRGEDELVDWDEAERLIFDD